jgi:flagellar biosynthesis protein FliR
MPLLLDPILPHAGPFLLVLCRLSGLFLAAPLLSSPAIPTQIKVFTLLTLALTIYPTINLHHEVPADLDLYMLAPMVVGELIIGLAIGLTATLPFFAVQLAGLLMGQQMGLGLAQIVNPGFGIDGDNIGQMLFLLTLVSFVFIGGVELLVGALITTFTLVPLGGFPLWDTPLELLTATLQSATLLAIQVAMPVLAVIFLENIVLGFLMKTIPSLNILNFGFPIRILLGLTVFIASLAFVKTAIESDVDHTMGNILNWASAP